MNDALAIVSAARDAGAEPALRVAGRVYTFGELAGLVRERLATLAAHPRDGTPYPVVGANTLETVVTLYALLEAAIPAVLLHPRLTSAELAEQLETVRQAGPVGYEGAAAVLFTSGTTGKPRGAVLTRAGLLASATASATNLGWERDDCWLLCMPLAHVGGLSILARCLIARRCVAMRDRFDPVVMTGIIDAERITLVSLVPTMLGRMLDQQWSAPPHLRAILLGGAAAPRRLLERTAARGLPVLVTYGLTEACSQVTTTRYETRLAPLGEGSGEPLPGIEVAIRDGRIHVSGATMMAGYWNEAPLAPGAWFDTGDLGTLDERGRLHVQARRTDLIVTGGENVYPAEVENVLEAIAGVEAAGVFGVYDEEWGRLVAAAVIIRGEPPADRIVAEFLAARLAPHKRPRRICLVDALPQTEAGKLDRARLREFAGRLRALSYRDDN